MSIYCISFWNISLLFWIIWFQMQFYMRSNLRFIIMSFMFLFPIANLINIVTLNLLNKYYLLFCHCLNSALAYCYIGWLLFHNTQDADVDRKYCCLLASITTWHDDYHHVILQWKFNDLECLLCCWRCKIEQGSILLLNPKMI